MTALIAVSDAAIWAIPVASAIVSLATLIYAAIGVRGAADARHVANLETELGEERRARESMEGRLTACENDRERLHGELKSMREREVELMRLIVNREVRGT